ncbi:hypothetical protein E2320_014378 [Naja naja]|nr:hypothetical protein E2320_014378 [Naja naja]
MAAERWEVTSVGLHPYETRVEKGVKMEEFERNGLALAGPTRFRKSPYVVQAFTVGEHFSRMTAKPTERDLEEGMLSPCWEAQWRDILKNTPSPYPGWSHPHIPETRAGEELLQEEAGGLLAPERPLKTSLDADPAEQGEDGEVLGEFEEVAMSFSREDDAGEKQPCREIKQEQANWLDKWESEDEEAVFEALLEKAETQVLEENFGEQEAPRWEQRFPIDKRRNNAILVY